MKASRNDMKLWLEEKEVKFKAKSKKNELIEIVNLTILKLMPEI